MTNLNGNLAYAVVQREMQTLLNSQRTLKRLNPTMQPWADGTAQQFPFIPS